MKNNLLSLGQLLEKGFTMKMEHKCLTVQDEKKKLILKAPLSKDRTFKFEIQNGSYKCLTAAVKNEDWVWHLRYGHLNFRSLNQLSKANIVHGLPIINLPNMMCEAYIMSKQHKRSFQKYVVNRTSKTLELVHSDVCGPISISSLGKNSYFVTFVDDFSRKIWVYLTKQKLEVLVVFKTFKSMVEK